MTDRKYAVAFGGELIEGVNATGVRDRLSRIWSALPASDIDALMGSKSATLKLFADRETADRFVAFMRQAGMVCWLRLLRPGEESSPLMAELPWSAQEADAMLAAATAPVPAAPKRVAPRAAPGPKAMTAVVAVVLCVAAAYWIVAPGSGPRKRSRGAEAVAAQAPASVEHAQAAASAEPAEIQAPTATPVSAASLMVPEPILVSAKEAPAAPKALPTAEAAKLESAAPAAPASTPPVLFSRAPQSQQVAMIQPAATARPVPIPAAADVITPPGYDRSKVPQPRYPVQAYRNREQGEVLLNVVVGVDGRPMKVTIDRTSGYSLLDRAAVAAVKGWQFTPGTRNGVPREAARQVAVGFKLDE